MSEKTCSAAEVLHGLQYSVNFVDPTHYIHLLPPEIYLLFWHYSPVLGHAYYSQNYASICGGHINFSYAIIEMGS